MILPLKVLGLFISEIANDNDIFLVDELLELLDNENGYVEMSVKEIDKDEY